MPWSLPPRIASEGMSNNLGCNHGHADQLSGLPDDRLARALYGSCSCQVRVRCPCQTHVRYPFCIQIRVLNRKASDGPQHPLLPLQSSPELDIYQDTMQETLLSVNIDEHDLIMCVNVCHQFLIE